MNALLTQLTDEQLIKLYIAGDADALSTLISKHKQKIFTSICLLINDKYIAEDIFQDVFIRVIETINAGRYNEEGKFINWALRIAHNASMDYFRNIKRNPTITSADDSDIFDVINFSDEGIEQKITHKETYSKLTKMLDKLPKDQREVIILRHYANLSFKEISELCHCSVNTSLGRMRYGLLALRKTAAQYQLA